MGKSMSKIESKIEGRISLLEMFIESKFDQHVYKRSDEVEALTMKGQCYPNNDDDDNNNKNNYNNNNNNDNNNSNNNDNSNSKLCLTRKHCQHTLLLPGHCMSITLIHIN